jgi:DNA-binding NarL/FixJ family response regulator
VTEPVRVLIADDEDLVRSGLVLMLGSQPGIAVAGDAGDGAQAVAEARRLRPDVVLMDIRMPGMDGLQATARITAAAGEPGAGYQARVIILTTFEQDEYVYEALRAGASGFLLKRTRPEDLIEAIRVVANGDALLAPSVTRRLIAHFAQHPRTATATSTQLSQLTGRERDVLVEVAAGLSNTEIAGRLFVGEQTVKTHIKHIFTKLDLRDRAQAVVFAYETGLVRADG